MPINSNVESSDAKTKSFPASSTQVSHHITLDNDLFAAHCSERLSVRTSEAIANIANGKNMFELNAVSEELIDILQNGMSLQSAAHDARILGAQQHGSLRSNWVN